MNIEPLIGDVLFSLRDLAYVLFNVTVPDFGYLFLSTTILMFILEFKNTYKIKRLEKRLRTIESKGTINDSNKSAKNGRKKA